MKRVMVGCLVGCLAAVPINGCRPSRIVPLRVCLADGAWGGLAPAEAQVRTADTIAAASRIWWTADIGFLPILDAVRVEDPQPPGPGELGDIRIRDGNGYGSDEADALVMLCDRALQERFPGPPPSSFTLIFVRELISDAGGILRTSGVSTQLAPTFDVAGSRLCGRPPSVTRLDVLGRTSIIETVQAGAIKTTQEASVVLAHELGHDLLLGHGDGLDNDADGPWDQFCDADEIEPPLPLGLNAAQKPLMAEYVVDGILLSPLQIERAQASADALVKTP